MQRWLVGAIVWAWAFHAQGQAEEPSGPPLTLGAAIQEALEKSPDLRAAEAAVQEAQGETKAQSVFAAQPALGLGTGLSPDGVTALGVSLEQNIPLRKRRKLAGASGEARSEARAAEASQTRARVAAEAGRAFVGYWLAFELAGLSQAQSGAAKAGREAAEKRKAAGDLGALEPLLARAEEERVQAEQRRAEGEREAARLGLAAQLGRKLRAPLLLAPPPKVTAPGDAANPPSLRAAEKSVVSASAAVDLARLGLLPDPSISVNGGFSRDVFEQGDFFGNNVAGAGIDRIEVREFAFSLQVSAPLPVFRDGYEGTVDAARARLAQAEAERDGVKRQNDAETQAAQVQLEAALAAEALLTTAVPRYEEALALTEKAYAGGALGIDALLLARTRVYTAKAELLRARAATLYARLDLAEARGEILGD